MRRVQLIPLAESSTEEIKPLEIAIERANGDAGRDFTAGLGDRRIDVRVDWHDAAGAGAAASRGTLHLHGRVVPFHAIRRDETIELWMQGRLWRFEVPQRTARRVTGLGASTASTGRLTAPMPGTVLKVTVADGDKFEAHQPLIVMESMKMEMTLSAPHAGRVAEVCCLPGQLVEMGAVLLRFADNAE